MEHSNLNPWEGRDDRLFWRGSSALTFFAALTYRLSGMFPPKKAMFSMGFQAKFQVSGFSIVAFENPGSSGISFLIYVLLVTALSDLKERRTKKRSKVTMGEQVDMEPQDRGTNSVNFAESTPEV